MKRLLILPLALMLVGYAISGCSSSSSKDKEQNDSIAAAEREAARLDSIRQDSIARRNFTSPDLEFHDLHGDVKKCVVNNNEYSTYTFDENGKWTNEPQWDGYDKKYCPERTKHPKVIRNKDGYITRIYNSCDADEEYEDISWKGDKIIGEGANVEYDEHGFPIYDEFEGWDGKDPSTQTVYYDYIVDDMGNWIQRSYFLKSWDPDNPDFISYFERTETRTITYYKKISQNRTALPNSSIQIQKLQALKASKQKKEQDEEKGPKWINGVWECHEMVDLGYFGRQRANARLCIDRENQMVSSNNDGEKYNGRYTISGNEIHFGSWYADLDNSRERIEFGKGVYYRKVSSSYTYGSSSNSSSGSSGSRSSYSGSSRTSFSSPSDVLSYTSSNSFYNGGDRLRIGFDAVYLNGTALTGAPRVTNISGSSATIIASNPYGGRALHFYVNASSGTITQNGDVYRAR